ncbi:glutamate synthase (NADPH) small subunit [Escherichia coli]|uniref:Glutamate synthase (NADPH) small subunit n=1 Tax=Escherichia coli TaxID=562 RepID=A0A377A5D9_ECOLX|nr:glutamate synthase (NADPH) small subunit [Escherichia coli]
MNSKLNTEVGRDVQLDDLLSDYDAVFLGVGTYQSMRGGLENEDADGVYAALPFLIANTKQLMGFGETRDEPFRQHGKANAWWSLAVATLRWTACVRPCARERSTLPVPIVVMKRTCRVPAAK